MAFPTTLALITALWSGAARTKSIALWSAIGGGDPGARPAGLRRAARSASPGGRSSSSAPPLAAIALFLAWRLVPAHVNETTEPVDNLGGILSIALDRAHWCWGSTSRRYRARGRLAVGARGRRDRRRGRLRPPPAPRPLAPCMTSRWPARRDLLGGGLRRDHRLRLADGGDVHRPAVPPERARLLDPAVRAGDPAGGGA